MANKTITLRIPDAKVATALQGFLAIYPNIEKVDDPSWVDPLDGSFAPKIAVYTNSQWVSEKIRRNTVRDIRRGLQMIANQAAKITDDDSIIETI